MLSYSKTAMERAMKVQGSHFAGEGEKDHRMAGQQKMAGATGCGKDAGWKSQKTTFPPSLEIPQTPAGFPLSHSLGDCGRLTKTGTFHLLRKGDISNVVRMGTFLMSVDKP
jgi:hypothetical protein